MELENSERLGVSLGSSVTNAHEVSAQAREEREKIFAKNGVPDFSGTLFLLGLMDLIKIWTYYLSEPGYDNASMFPEIWFYFLYYIAPVSIRGLVISDSRNNAVS